MHFIGLKTRFRVRSLWLKYVERARYRPERPIFFIHIPKTAGTSFRNMLFRLIDQEVSFPSLQDLGKNDGNYLTFEEVREILPLEQRKILFLTGHFPFAAGELLAAPVEYYVFLRDPIDRTISNLLHFQRNYPENKDRSLLEVFEKHRGHLQNLQTRFLSVSTLDQMEAFYQPDMISKKHLDLAKANLEKCTFVGLTERFSDSLLMAEQLLGAKLGSQLKRNVAPISAKQQLDPLLVEQIQPYLELDQELYHFALQLFEKRKLLILNK
ncbi:sulfotransferase family 2 domain-containing protein [Flavilitoribacter nigricans]|uniref:Sulfotransferase family protein n=1 Tax=Flavilitoribacter nigricans (strain ATCC 23147 / DSM 23189 / NBRC 102662 / NCIMB 1420 / SS-2) TaxID=1122177 RepID=A0A2D0ND76_FLAN2|nr:sulfotransferase family 2 domain-containing protein [Flavilitoribacter nigricans]PHN06452.1 hypothetical protein CRP01_12860 [Flavilitoribacter nigricans DSM 23189 = NBRC 102662]